MVYNADMKAKSLRNTLDVVWATLPELLEYPEHWQSLDVDYEPPRVERVFLDEAGIRICLHVIHKTDKPCLFHPHPWPSIMAIMEGSYLNVSGFEGSNERMETIYTAGSCYEMLDPTEWHSVSPITETVKSIMIMGEQWGFHGGRKPTKKLQPLSRERKLEIINDFKALLTVKEAVSV